MPKLQDIDTCVQHIESRMSQMSKAVDKITNTDAEFPLLGITSHEGNHAPDPQEETTTKWTNVVNKKDKVSRPSTIRGIVNDAILESTKESEQKEVRARNLVIFRAEEPTQEDRRKRNDDDLGFFKKLCKEIEVKDIDIEEVTRLGKKEEGRNRPLRIKVGDLEQKTKIMKNLKNLGNDKRPFSAVTVAHDLTIDQRHNQKALIAKANEKTESSLQNGFVYIVINFPGPYWDPKIVKLKARQRPPLANAREDQSPTHEAREQRIQEKVERRLPEGIQTQPTTGDVRQGRAGDVVAEDNNTGDHRDDRDSKETATTGQRDSQLYCFYTNADSLPNKITELRARIGSMVPAPDIIAITDVKPQNGRFSLHVSDFMIQGYLHFTTDLEAEHSRGIVIWVREELDQGMLCDDAAKLQRITLDRHQAEPATAPPVWLYIPQPKC
ncbi:hypothetical protein CAPTEDRAFT_193367 [Capitella teleta]|uniref:Uncharacterized protein n=1 Tax=Capitella teleta TaxID=283909 RepID=R7UVC3_CAPTE|nr:hypothetical protein CAPTEDRAFT_193367 [Capitella teleta]|eukprot:ELU10063.1 hypothetical protein CAPTEDRAFT_193367 [Capitella teleta]